MKLIRLTLILVCLLGTPSALWAGDIHDQVVQQLQAQGFSDIELRRTILGRIRITATSDEYWREIVLNPRTGEILRDYWRLIDASMADATPLLMSPSADDAQQGSNGSNTGSGASEPEDDNSGGGGDDGGDDGAEDDHSSEDDTEDHSDED